MVPVHSLHSNLLKKIMKFLIIVFRGNVSLKFLAAGADTGDAGHTLFM